MAAVRRHAGIRLLAALVIGAVGAMLLVRLGHVGYALAGGWAAFGLAYVSRTWWVIGRLDPSLTAAHAGHDEPDGTVATELIVLCSCLASLLAVAYLLTGGSAADKVPRALVSVLAVTVSWILVHTVYTLRYARLYYAAAPPGGVDFGDDAPAYADFAYLAFTMGMTYQVSDTTLRSGEFRRTALAHCLLSYVFGTVVLASTINAVIGLAA